MKYNTQWADYGGVQTTDGSTWVDLAEVSGDVLSYPGMAFLCIAHIAGYIHTGLGEPTLAGAWDFPFMVNTAYAGGIAGMQAGTPVHTVDTGATYDAVAFQTNMADVHGVPGIQVKGIAGKTIEWACVIDVVGDSRVA